MHKRQIKKEAVHSSRSTEKKPNVRKKHPIQQIMSTIPQLGITFAILFCFFLSASSSLRRDGSLFYVSCICLAVMCFVFLALQVTGAEYKNWQQTPKTRQYIQIASASALIAFIGFNITYWPLFSLLTPIFVATQFIFIISFLIVSLAITDMIRQVFL